MKITLKLTLLLVLITLSFSRRTRRPNPEVETIDQLKCTNTPKTECTLITDHDCKKLAKVSVLCYNIKGAEILSVSLKCSNKMHFVLPCDEGVKASFRVYLNYDYAIERTVNDPQSKQ